MKHGRDCEQRVVPTTPSTMMTVRVACLCMQAESETLPKPSCEHRCAERYPGPRPSRRQTYTIFGGDADDASSAHSEARIEVLPLPGGPCMRRMSGEAEEGAEGAVAKAVSLWMVSSWDWRGVRRGGRRAASSSSSSESAVMHKKFCKNW
jgi:hypothetical protein